MKMALHLDTTCTFTTVTSSATTTPNIMSPKSDGADVSDKMSMFQAPGFAYLDCKSPWSVLCGDINQPLDRPSWTDLHDILNTKSEALTSSENVDVQVDENQNVISITPIVNGIGSSLEDHLTNGISISTSPINIAQKKPSRKRPRTPSCDDSDESPSGRKMARRQSGSDDEQDNTTDLFSCVSRAILNAKDGLIILADIYSFMIQNYAIYRDNQHKNWRVRVRHVLSVNSCFVKGKRAKSGRGFYWMIHPACIDAFKDGNISRRSSAQLVRVWQNKQAAEEKQRCQNNQSPTDSIYSHNSMDRDLGSYFIPDRVARHERIYIPMTIVPLSDHDYFDLLMNLTEAREQQ